MSKAWMAVAPWFLASVAVAQSPAPAEWSESGFNWARSHQVVISTEQGEIVVQLLPDLAPKHVAHFVKTAKAGGYDGTTFHRIIAGGIIQGGDPLSKDPKKVSQYGSGGLGLLPAEFSATEPFARGVVAAARRPSSKDSGGSQFFIVLAEQPSLKGQYTIFGRVTSGLEVADKISLTPVTGDKPTARVPMKVTIREVAATQP